MRGGVGDYTRELALALADRGQEIHVITSRLNEAKGHESDLSLERITVHRAIHGWGWRFWRTLRRILRRVNPDILHIQYQSAAYGLHPAVNLLPLYIRRWSQRPLIAVTFHDLRVPYIFPKAGHLRWWSVLALARWADLAIVTNPKDERTLSTYGLGNRLVQIPIGSNIRPSLPPDYDREEWRARWGVREDEILLSYFGFLNASKGGEELVRALGNLVGRGYETKLLMIGGRVGSSDPTNRAYLHRVQTLIAELGLTERVLWTGYTPATEVTANFVATDICVLPYRDGVSFRRGSFMAALAHGMPIVTTIPQVELPSLVDGENVCLVPPKDVRALTQAIAQLIESPQLRTRLGKGAQLLARSFEWGTIAKRTLEAYYDHIRV